MRQKWPLDWRLTKTMELARLVTYRLQGVFTAIADPHRREILEILAAGDMSAGDLAGKFSISRPAVANHLRILEENGLVCISQRGRQRIHSLDMAGMTTVRDWLSHFDAFWDSRLDRLRSLVEREPDE